ncbi:hypothetical protein [Nocardioides convexus]|uniref:hypothetical protein n=1 Tax=Nocardioides convexus TaxID=2712224 RepID=UPI0024188F79|nr:hypothetical protein [Nocardioides convexus]
MCDNPICVRFAGEQPADLPAGTASTPAAGSIGGRDHLLLSTQSANLTRMGRRGRGGGDPTHYRFTRL